MEVIHVSAECYPVAKAGGLGDVVGALPKYQNRLGHFAKVVMPMYRTPFLFSNQWETVHKGNTNMGNWWFDYTVIREATNHLGFDLYLVDIYGLLDRPKVYGYSDDIERFTAFQIAVVDWLSVWNHRPDVLHVHDHQAALIPFMIKHCYRYQHLSSIPTVLTIHNAQYQGWIGWDKSLYLPPWDTWQGGQLEWNKTINSLASGVKCAWKVTTVSPNYLLELRINSNGLEALFEYERGKCSGILNGIDVNVWDPANDEFLGEHFSAETMEEGKLRNKTIICETFGLDPKKPLFVFIGRLVGEKGADLLPHAVRDSFYYIGRKMSFLMLGSGAAEVESQLQELDRYSHRDYHSYIGYNEALSHLMYAGADFLLMPSRVEPCGLNQLYAMRYGTTPIVRRTGGLRDTVIDYGEPGGYGICFDQATVGDITQSIWRALELYKDRERASFLRKKMMLLDFSWESSVGQYLELYQGLKSA